jgi:TATA-box binding protein (TBP) (component of TFIID and TFIIIB)
MCKDICCGSSSSTDAVLSNDKNNRRQRCRSVTALIFRSGAVCLIGAHTEEECIEAAESVARRANFSIYVDRPAQTTVVLNKNNNKQKRYSVSRFRVFAFRICNLAATFHCEKRSSTPIGLDALSIELKSRLSHQHHKVQLAYQPECFNGLRLKLTRYCRIDKERNKSKGNKYNNEDTHETPSALIFTSGKVILTGCASKAAIKTLPFFSVSCSSCFFLNFFFLLHFCIPIGQFEFKVQN